MGFKMGMGSGSEDNHIDNVRKAGLVISLTLLAFIAGIVLAMLLNNPERQTKIIDRIQSAESVVEEPDLGYSGELKEEGYKYLVLYHGFVGEKLTPVYAIPVDLLETAGIPKLETSYGWIWRDEFGEATVVQNKQTTHTERVTNTQFTSYHILKATEPNKKDEVLTMMYVSFLDYESAVKHIRRNYFNQSETPTVEDIKNFESKE